MNHTPLERASSALFIGVITSSVRRAVLENFLFFTWRSSDALVSPQVSQIEKQKVSRNTPTDELESKRHTIVRSFLR